MMVQRTDNGIISSYGREENPIIRRRGCAAAHPRRYVFSRGESWVAYLLYIQFLYQIWEIWGF